MVADIAAEFVLLVAGGCARAVVVPLFYYLRDHPDWWGEDREAYGAGDICVAMTEDEALDALARLTKRMEKQYTGTKNAGKVPGWEPMMLCEGADSIQAKVKKAAENVRKAEEEFMRLRPEGQRIFEYWCPAEGESIYSDTRIEYCPHPECWSRLR